MSDKGDPTQSNPACRAFNGLRLTSALMINGDLQEKNVLREGSTLQLNFAGPVHRAQVQKRHKLPGPVQPLLLTAQLNDSKKAELG